jgi:hypothetical protein
MANCYQCFNILISNCDWYYAHDHCFCCIRCRYLYILALDENQCPSTTLSIQIEKPLETKSVPPIISTHNPYSRKSFNDIKIRKKDNRGLVQYTFYKSTKYSNIIRIMSFLLSFTYIDKFLDF